MLLLLACAGEITTEPVFPDETSEFDGATLSVVSPTSNSFHPLDTPTVFEAVIVDPDGNPLDFDPIWTSSLDWEGTGALFEEELDVGTHDIQVVAELPNGDVLKHDLSGILVQHEDAGVYVGDLSVSLAIDVSGTAFQAACTGATELTVDAYGELIDGDSACTISLLGYELETTYVFYLEADDGLVGGETAADLSWFELPFETTGEIFDGVLTGAFGADVAGYATVEGSFEAVRVTRNLPEEEIPSE